MRVPLISSGKANGGALNDRIVGNEAQSDFGRANLVRREVDDVVRSQDLQGISPRPAVESCALPTVRSGALSGSWRAKSNTDASGE